MLQIWGAAQQLMPSHDQFCWVSNWLGTKVSKMFSRVRLYGGLAVHLKGVFVYLSSLDSCEQHP